MFLKLAIIVTIFLLIFIFVEGLQRKFDLKFETSRKLAHISSGIIVFFFPYYLSVSEIIALSAVFAVSLIISKFFNILPSIHKVERRTFGEIFFPLGIGICAFYFLPDEPLSFQFGIMVLTFSDSLAALVGEKFGRHKVVIFNHTKTLEGSMTFYASTVVLMLIMAPNLNMSTLLIILLYAMLLSGLELILTLGLDNLLLPVISALVFSSVLY
jgi:phytol kinase